VVSKMRYTDAANASNSIDKGLEKSATQNHRKDQMFENLQRGNRPCR